MNTTSAALASAVTFVWLGMVLAISFLEAPLKFRAPGVTIPVGLGIGRLVFRALNLVETVLAVVMIVAVAVGAAPASVVGLTAAVAAVLLAQLVFVRPRLNRRSDRVLAGEEGPRSRGHLAYVALELAKVGILIALGVCLVSV
ncbi:hypothetical protein C1I97_08090 [Streptomyces sp. NTH33]|uniref:hypothetical protein n=1 Tax=Streptomyces sp. NTH33 TaxID=1735453 RepID=UPI000DA7061C|nr:hypothetical protein [Streptomyces sp. NTH33]PZH15528.1 hypothetical protein C1I97_08090 [Streptomyces sp. NTH33]